MSQFNENKEIKKLKDQAELFQNAYFQLNVIVDDKIRNEVKSYKKSSILGRWWYRATNDSDILTKATAISYLDAANKLKEIQNQLSVKISDVKRKIFIDPTDTTSELPYYPIKELSPLIEGTVAETAASLSPLMKGKKYLDSVLQEAAELNEVNFFVDRKFDAELKGYKNQSLSLMDQVNYSVKELFSGWVSNIRAVVSRRMLNPDQYCQKVTEKLKKSVKEDFPEKIQASQNLAAEIKDEFDKLSTDHQQQFNQKYPDYFDSITLEIMIDPVVWKGDSRIYERASIKEWLNSKFNDGVSVIKSPLNGTNVELTQEKNAIIVSSTQLQTEILENLKAFNTVLKSENGVTPALRR